jgi:hypothetical protein
MINLEDFNLIYLRKEDSRKYLVRHVTKYDSVAIDSVTGEVQRLTWYYLAKLFRPDLKSNKANKKKMRFMNFGKKRIA